MCPTSDPELTIGNNSNNTLPGVQLPSSLISSSKSSSSSSSSGVSSDGSEHSGDDEDSLPYCCSSTSSDHRRHASSSTSSVSSTDMLTDPHSPLPMNDHQQLTGLQCYTFIPDGEFDIVWPNVIAFVIGHLIHFYSLYVLFTTLGKDITIVYTWFWSEYTHSFWYASWYAITMSLSVTFYRFLRNLCPYTTDPPLLAACHASLTNHYP